MREYKIPGSEIVKAKCCDCRASYADGRNVDCKATSCPLYILTKTAKQTPNLNWVFDYFKKYNAMISDTLSREQITERLLNNLKSKQYPVSRSAVLRAKCKECMNNFKDGRVDCEIISCPLYPYMPYRKLNPCFDWLWDLGYTTRHQLKIFEMECTREEYVDRRYRNQPKQLIRYRKLATPVVHEHGADDSSDS